MSVIGVAQEASDTGELAFEANGTFSIRRRFRVICSSVQDDAQVATSAPGLPPLFSTYVSPVSANASLRARRYSARRLFPASLVWLVDVFYETPPTKDGTGGGTGRDTDGQYENPLLEPPTVEMNVTEREELLGAAYDLNTGNIRPVTNSAGQVYDPPPKTTSQALELTIERNEPITANHPGLAWAYQDTVNADVFWGLPPGAWKCVSIMAKRAEKQLPGGVTAVYLRVNYKFQARATWDICLLDCGQYWIGPPAAAVSNPANLYLPYAPGAINPWGPPNTYGLPSGATLSPTRFIEQKFKTADGHPIRGSLNGCGGPLPGASTFMANYPTDSTFIVPAPSASAPGQWVNGLACQVSNIGGSLPAPLEPNVVYYTYNVANNGLSFELSTLPGTRFVIFTGYVTEGFPEVNFGPNGPAYAPGTPPELETTMVVTSVPPGYIPAGTTISAIGVNNADITLSANSTVTGIITLMFTAAADIVVTTSAGSGINTIQPLGVFGRIRQYQWVPFAPLGLPQNFFGVQ